MNKFIVAGIMLVSAPFVSFAQTSTTDLTPVTGTITITNPGLMPGDFFYFLDRWSEVLNIAITFNKENKARKHFEYAKERVAEMSEVLKNPSAKLENIARAKTNFDERIAQAADIVKGEKDKGSDVANIARELDNELQAIREELTNILKEHKDKASREEEEIRAKLDSLSPTDPQVKGLTQALESITKEKSDAAKEEEDVDGDLEDEQKLFEEIMGKEMSAQKHLDEALRLKARLEGLAGQLPPDVIAASQDFLNKAREADARGDFEAAKQFSKQAKKVFEKAQDAVEESANEMKEDLEDFEVGDIKDLHIDDLEEEIKNSEKAMEGFNR